MVFCDEPTSGLDSFTANKIVKILNKIASRGRIVISSIHQPNSSTFNTFPKLILIAEGRIIYQGSAQKSAEYFTNMGFILPSQSNPADYFLKEFYVPPRMDSIT